MISKRFYILLFCLFITVAGLVYRAAFVIVGPDNVEKVNLVLMNRSPISLQRLNEHAEKLEEMTNNIDNYTFSTIKLEIDKTIKLVNFANLELKAQYDAWISVKSSLKNDGDSLAKLKEQLDTTRNLQEQEIVKLKNILDNIQKPSIIADLINLTLTFIFGVLSSVIASIGINKWKNRHKSSQR